MKIDCPHGDNHAVAVRHDPESTGMRAYCDTCGWTAPYVVARDSGRYRPAENHELESAQVEEGKRRQLAAGGQEQSRRRAD